jgi:uncharacterized membrane protein YqjE
MQRNTSLQELRRKFQKPTIFVFVNIVAVAIQLLAIDKGLNRAFWVGVFFLVMLAMVFLVYDKKRRILAVDGGLKRNLEIARLKLEAEKTAGFALIFAVGLFYQFGFEFDKTSIAAQALRWQSVNEQIQINMTDTFCSVVPNRKEKCQNIQKDVSSLFFSIYSKDGESTQKIAQRIIKIIRDELEIPQHSDQAKAFDSTLVVLQSMDVSEGILNMIAKCLPIMSVVLGCVAVSSKIAVARVDFDERAAAATASENQQEMAIAA